MRVAVYNTSWSYQDYILKVLSFFSYLKTVPIRTKILKPLKAFISVKKD